MSNEMAVNAEMGADAMVVRKAKTAMDVRLENYWTVECLSPPDDTGARRVKWRESLVPNVVFTEGKNLLLDIAFQGTAKPTWYARLIADGNTAYAAGDTLSTINSEFLRYTQGGSSSVGGAVTFAAASAGSAGSSAAVVFTITQAGTISGAFLATTATGTGGRAYGAVDFTGGDRTVASGDVLNVSVSTTAS
jgi:hypothetical protein